MFTQYRIARGGGGWGVGGVPLYKPYRYVPPQRVWFFRRFGLKTGIDFAYFGLESGMVFEKTTGRYESIYRRFQFQMNKKERELCEFVVGFKSFFVGVLL